MKNYFAEFFGTFWLVLGGCGSALFAAGVPDVGIGFVGVSLAFGLTVLTMAYAVGPISGGHFNPAVSIGMYIGGRFSGKEILPYIGSQLAGAICAAVVLYLIYMGSSVCCIDNKLPGAFAANGYGHLSPSGFNLLSAFVTEFVLTAFFILIILGATDKKASGKFAGIAIGLALTLIHLISIPITNTSVNPARSISQALFAGGEYIPQLWLFITAPILGAIVGGVIYKYLLQDRN
ncbi:aquaporin Z [Myroides profundi]|uniref:Aquaporin Z n=1 Tax=Myroides profundi TaxID=480520 RepID=A0AAJ5BFJ2_MYRPR|nr:aquaporin Z [Myroides profundi]AJH15272.1 aquaporin Z [Myroides profundi]SER66772.1 aquaporin Z [Myroides profundi]